MADAGEIEDEAVRTGEVAPLVLSGPSPGVVRSCAMRLVAARRGGAARELLGAVPREVRDAAIVGCEADRSEQWSVMCEAAVVGDAETVRYLLAAGVPPGAVEPARGDGRAAFPNSSPLYIAANSGMTGVCEALVRAGARAGGDRGPMGIFPLVAAARSGMDETAAALIRLEDVPAAVLELAHEDATANGHTQVVRTVARAWGLRQVENMMLAAHFRPGCPASRSFARSPLFEPRLAGTVAEFLAPPGGLGR